MLNGLKRNFVIVRNEAIYFFEGGEAITNLLSLPINPSIQDSLS